MHLFSVHGCLVRMPVTKKRRLAILIYLYSLFPMQKSAFSIVAIVYQLEESTGHKVDLVQEGMIKPFARENVEKDKILIYERETS